MEVVHTEMHVGRKFFSIEIWDHAGSLALKHLHFSFFSGSSVFLFCYDISYKGSLRNLTSIWVPEVAILHPHIPFIFVGNKFDLATKKNYSENEEVEEVSLKEGNKVSKKVGGFAHIQCSAKDYGEKVKSNSNVDLVFQTAVKCYLKKVNNRDKNHILNCALL